MGIFTRYIDRTALYLAGGLTLVYALMSLLPAEWAAECVKQLSLPCDAESLGERPWSMVSYAMVHTRPLHLLTNLAMLLFVTATADTVCRRYTAAAFAAGTVAGAMAYVMASSAPSGLTLIGASAAVMGVVSMVATLASPRRRRILGSIALALVVADALLIGSHDVVSHLSHLAGAAAGGALGAAVILLRRIRNRGNNSANADVEVTNAGHIMTKARTSGYASLTPEERRTLFNLSHRQS